MTGDDLFGNPVEPCPTPAKAWVPEFLVDEISPLPRATPDAWLIAGTRDGEYWMTDEEDEDSETMAVAIGDVVSFWWVRYFGTVVFTISPDGSFTTSAPLPASANHYYDPTEWESMAVTPEEFAADWAGNEFDGQDDAAPVEVVVGIQEWGAAPFRLVMNKIGRAAFVEVDDD